ncbi:unnamed protein product, partial [Iphiclides podalirius]
MSIFIWRAGGALRQSLDLYAAYGSLVAAEAVSHSGQRVDVARQRSRVAGRTSRGCAGGEFCLAARRVARALISPLEMKRYQFVICSVD